jgi:hypothetical protein
MWQRDLLASCGGGGMISLPLCVVSDQHSTERVWIDTGLERGNRLVWRAFSWNGIVEVRGPMCEKATSTLDVN